MKFDFIKKNENVEHPPRFEYPKNPPYPGILLNPYPDYDYPAAGRMEDRTGKIVVDPIYKIVLKCTNRSILNTFYKFLLNRKFPETVCMGCPLLPQKMFLLKSPHVNKKSKVPYSYKRYHTTVLYIYPGDGVKGIQHILRNRPRRISCVVHFLPKSKDDSVAKYGLNLTFDITRSILTSVFPLYLRNRARLDREKREEREKSRKRREEKKIKENSFLEKQDYKTKKKK